jgi:hypothetical protein
MALHSIFLKRCRNSVLLRSVVLRIPTFGTTLNSVSGRTKTHRCDSYEVN